MLKQSAPNFDAFADTINAGYEFNPPQGGVAVQYPAMHTEGAYCTGLAKVVDGQFQVESGFQCYN